MVDRGSLESILASLEPSPWTGQVFRVMLNDYPPDRENTQGARWNPPDTPAIYTCLHPEVCIAEVEYGLACQSRPVKSDLRKTLYHIEVGLAAVLDLGPALSRLAIIGIGLEQLFAEDMKASQEVGRLVTWFGSDGLLVPSARRQGSNLVIYPGRANEGFMFEVIDQKRL
jgi:RES domain-containing protein